MDSIDEAMLRSFTKPVEQLPVQISLDEQQNKLISCINSLPKEDRYDIGHIMVSRGFRNKIQDVHRGSSVNMADIPPEVVYEMYALLIYKLECQKKR